DRHGAARRLVPGLVLGGAGHRRLANLEPAAAPGNAADRNGSVAVVDRTRRPVLDDGSLRVVSDDRRDPKRTDARRVGIRAGRGRRGLVRATTRTATGRARVGALVVRRLGVVGYADDHRGEAARDFVAGLVARTACD